MILRKSTVPLYGLLAMIAFAREADAGMLIEFLNGCRVYIDQLTMVGFAGRLASRAGRANWRSVIWTTKESAQLWQREKHAQADRRQIKFSPIVATPLATFVSTIY